MKTWQVDPAAPEAQATLRRLRDTLFPADDPVDVTQGLWWVVEDTGRGLLVGFAGLHLRHQGEPLTGYICLTGVLPEYRGQRLQRRLTHTMLRKARHLGLHRVVTDTLPSNPPSVNSLIACGFRAFAPEVPWKVDGAAYWERVLA